MGIMPPKNCRKYFLVIILIEQIVFRDANLYLKLDFELFGLGS